MQTVFLENLLVAQPVDWKSEVHCRVHNSEVLAFILYEMGRFDSPLYGPH